MPFTASNTAAWVMASAREAAGGLARVKRMAFSAARFHSITGSAASTGSAVAETKPRSQVEVRMG
ncbi:MAG: hypothetical protein ACKVYV_12675 [Limisphaerales bacterium]